MPDPQNSDVSHYGKWRQRALSILNSIFNDYLIWSEIYVIQNNL